MEQVIIKNEKYISVKEAAKILDITPGAVRGLISGDSPKMASVLIKNRRYIRKVEIDCFKPKGRGRPKGLYSDWRNEPSKKERKRCYNCDTPIAKDYGDGLCSRCRKALGGYSNRAVGIKYKTTCKKCNMKIVEEYTGEKCPSCNSPL